MPDAKVRIHALSALPCRHDLAGRPHASLSSAYRCVTRNGIPGLRVTEIRLVRYGRDRREALDGP